MIFSFVIFCRLYLILFVLLLSFYRCKEVILGLEEQWYFLPERLLSKMYPENATTLDAVFRIMRDDALLHNRLYLRGI